MRFKIAAEPWILRSYIPELVELAGAERWQKRVTNLRSSARSPYLARIASDYHWVELQLDEELAKRQVPVPSNSDTDPVAATNGRSVGEAEPSMTASDLDTNRWSDL